MNTNIVPNFSRYSFFSFSLLLLIGICLISCTRNDAQRDFEEEAYSYPSNYTQTTAQGEIETTDDNDWRISPLFQGLIEIKPPFPNPVTTNQAIQFEVEVTGIQSVSGIEVLVRFNDNSFRSIYQDFETLQPGLTTFQISPIELAQFGNPEGARGLNRIFIFDAKSQMISYGDILVE